MSKTLLLLSFCTLLFLGCNKSSNSTQTPQIDNSVHYNAPMVGEFRSRTLFENPYANIPAQCYIETSYGTQNACLFCHTNAPARAMLGNTTPQAGMDLLLGNLQLEYAFGTANRFVVSPNINPWENTLKPHKLDEAFEKLGIDSTLWDMQKYIKQDNWSNAYAKKQGNPTSSNSGIKEDAYRLFPALNPSSLPAQSDGFVRTQNEKEALFKDSIGYNTGWRSINFMPYGIFTPHTGSVSGVYIRLPLVFMQDAQKNFDIAIYKKNLELLEQAIQDRIEENTTHYLGAASAINIYRGLFPVGTEFAHPLHYVDVQADDTFAYQNRFPGTRANRVKEVRYMYKWKMFHPQEPISKDEDAPLYYNTKEHWIDNGAGWYLSSFIEDKEGELRPQDAQELMQCVGCHSSRYGFEPEQFNSGTGNTIDTVWSFPRKFAGDLGWREMDYLAYRFGNATDENKTAGSANRGDPINRDANIGEYRKFLNHVVGASLYGDMPSSMEKYLRSIITQTNGYSDNFPSLEFDSVEQLKQIQQKRLELMREFTQTKDYLDTNGYIQAPLLYPTLKESLTGAMRYKKVVVTQRYKQGKDYFGDTLFTYKYYRDANQSHTHIDGTPYQWGEVITDRPYHTQETILWGVGKIATLIDENGDNYDPEYMPLLKYPLTYESK